MLFCEVVGACNYQVSALSSGDVKIVTTMNDISLDVTIPSNIVSLELDPTASLETADLSAYVTTTAPYGYTLLMTASDTNFTRTEDIGGVYPTIPTLAKESTQVGFAANHWGYKLPADTKYKPFDNTGSQIGYSDVATTDKEEVVTFAAKANSVTPTGVYELTLTISAVANSKPVGIEDVVYMQDFAEASDADKSSILASMTEGTSYTIKDSRDEQDYTVAKLFDGNIWMTKNLDLAGGTTLTPDKSNVTSNYTLPASSTSGFSNDSTAYVYNSGRTNCASPGCYSYYSFVAATAGTNPSSGNAASDICPAGWRLPTKSEYETLIDTYNTGAKLIASPFLGVYSGYYNNSSLMGGTTYGFGWSSTADTNTHARRMCFSKSTACSNASSNVDSHTKRFGFPIRCIVK